MSELALPKKEMDPSYLGSMSEGDRAMAIVLALKANLSIKDLYNGGYVQFMTVCRKPMANWGATNQDLEHAWRFVCLAHFKPVRFKQLAEIMQKQSAANARAH